MRTHIRFERSVERLEVSERATVVRSSCDAGALATSMEELAVQLSRYVRTGDDQF